MHFFLLLFTSVIFASSLFAKLTDSTESRNSSIESEFILEKPKSSTPLLNENSFVVFYVFAEKKLEPFLKEAMIKQLEKLGTIYSDNSQLTEAQKKEKYKIGGGLLHIIVTPIMEETGNSISDYKVLPVLECSVKVIEGVELLSNEIRFSCPVWEKKQFISTDKATKKLKQKAVASLETVIDAFIADYQQANPGKKPEFFLYH